MAKAPLAAPEILRHRFIRPRQGIEARTIAAARSEIAELLRVVRKLAARRKGQKFGLSVEFVVTAS